MPLDATAAAAAQGKFTSSIPPRTKGRPSRHRLEQEAAERAEWRRKVNAERALAGMPPLSPSPPAPDPYPTGRRRVGEAEKQAAAAAAAAVQVARGSASARPQRSAAIVRQEIGYGGDDDDDEEDDDEGEQLERGEDGEDGEGEKGRRWSSSRSAAARPRQSPQIKQQPFSPVASHAHPPQSQSQSQSQSHGHAYPHSHAHIQVPSQMPPQHPHAHAHPYSHSPAHSSHSPAHLQPHRFPAHLPSSAAASTAPAPAPAPTQGGLRPTTPLLDLKSQELASITPAPPNTDPPEARYWFHNLGPPGNSAGAGAGWLDLSNRSAHDSLKVYQKIVATLLSEQDEHGNLARRAGLVELPHEESPEGVRYFALVRKPTSLAAIAKRIADDLAELSKHSSTATTGPAASEATSEAPPLTLQQHPNYPTPRAFELDLMQLFENARRFLPHATPACGAALQLQRLFQTLTSGDPTRRSTRERRYASGKQLQHLGALQSLPPDETLQVTLAYKDRRVQVGDWVHAASEKDPSRPLVACIFRLSTSPTLGARMWLNYYARPEETSHDSNKTFHPQEILKTNVFGVHDVADLLEHTFVLFDRKWLRMRPTPDPRGQFWRTHEQVWMCADRWRPDLGTFIKIKNWAQVLPEGIKESDRLDSLEEPLEMPPRVSSPFLRGVVGPGRLTTEPAPQRVNYRSVNAPVVGSEDASPDPTTPRAPPKGLSQGVPQALIHAAPHNLTPRTQQHPHGRPPPVADSTPQHPPPSRQYGPLPPAVGPPVIVGQRGPAESPFEPAIQSTLLESAFRRIRNSSPAALKPRIDEALDILKSRFGAHVSQAAFERLGSIEGPALDVVELAVALGCHGTHNLNLLRSLQSLLMHARAHQLDELLPDPIATRSRDKRKRTKAECADVWSAVAGSEAYNAMLPEETQRLFERDERGKVLWYPAPPLDGPTQHLARSKGQTDPTLAKYSLAYLAWRAGKRAKG